MLEEEAVVKFKVYSQQFPVRAEKNHETPRSRGRDLNSRPFHI
jgi:hypothetical protein